MDISDVTSLHHLPLDILSLIGSMLLQLDNPSILVKLSLSSKAMHSSISLLDSLFMNQSSKQGWLLEGHAAAALMAALTPFEAFTSRMQARWTVRMLLKRLILHLPRHDSLALQPGASLDELKGAEARLFSSASAKNRGQGNTLQLTSPLHLPTELWELLRFRNGQSREGKFVDDTRLLSTLELSVEWQTLPLHLHLQLNALDLSFASKSDDGSVAISEAGTGRGGGEGEERLMVVMAANESMTRRYLVDLETNRVFIARGLSIVASLSSSVSGLIRKILT